MMLDDDFCGCQVYDCPECEDKARILVCCQREVEDLLSQVFSYRPFDAIMFESALENLCCRLDIPFPNKEMRIGRK